jgi:hypothetical protein
LFCFMMKFDMQMYNICFDFQNKLELFFEKKN